MAWHSDPAAWSGRAFRGSSPPRAGSSSFLTTGRRSTRTWRCSRIGGMYSCSSPARRRCTARPGTWFDDPEIYQWFAANLHRVREPSYGITCGPENSRPPAWTGPPSWRSRPRTSGAACRRAAGHAAHGVPRAGQSVRRAGGRMPGDFLQLRRKLAGANGSGNGAG